MYTLSQKYLDSREVAEMVGKKHYNLIRDIKGYVEELGKLKIELSDFSQILHTGQPRTRKCLAILSQRRVASLLLTS